MSVLDSYFRLCKMEGVDRETAKRALWQTRLRYDGSTYFDAYLLAKEIKR